MRESEITSKVSALEATMRELGILPDEYELRVQFGSAYYGNASWVAVTGGHYGTGIDCIDALTLGPKSTKSQFNAVISAYHSALYATKLGAVTWSIANATGRA